jgi:hypothetical protein
LCYRLPHDLILLGFCSWDAGGNNLLRKYKYC